MSAGAVEAEFKSQSHVGGILAALLVCIAIGFASSIVGMALNQVTTTVLVAAFIGVPIVLLIFFAVRRSASTPSVIVSDRGLETSTSDETIVIRWREIAAVGLFIENGTTRIRYLTHDQLAGSVEVHLGRLAAAGDTGAEAAAQAAVGEPGADNLDDDLDDDIMQRLLRAEREVKDDLPQWGTAMPVIPRSRADEAALAWNELLRRFAGDRYQGVRRVIPDAVGESGGDPAGA